MTVIDVLAELENTVPQKGVYVLPEDLMLEVRRKLRELARAGLAAR